MLRAWECGRSRKVSREYGLLNKLLKSFCWAGNLFGRQRMVSLVRHSQHAIKYAIEYGYEVSHHPIENPHTSRIQFFRDLPAPFSFLFFLLSLLHTFTTTESTQTRAPLADKPPPPKKAEESICSSSLPGWFPV